jgi:hypothetical protein
VINISSFPIHKTPIKGKRPPTNDARITFESIGVKRKKSSIFTPIIEAMDQNNKIVVEATDQISFMQLHINKNKKKFQEKAFKQHLQYLKDKDKKIQKMHNNMVSVLSNLNMAM